MSSSLFIDDRKREPQCSFCQRRKSEVKTLASNNRSGLEERHICGECARAFKLALDNQNAQEQQHDQPEPQL